MNETLRPGDFPPESFIARADWQAAARPFRDPHEYAIRGRGEVDPEEHDAMIEFIAANGYREPFEGRTYTYLRLGEFIYWTSRGIYQPHPIINRRRAETA